MRCPACKNELPGMGFTDCPVCGHEFGEDDIPGSISWVLVYTTSTEIDAEMFRANLENAGIPAQLLSQIDTTRMFTIGHLAIVKIYVPDIYEKDAKELIARIERKEY